MKLATIWTLVIWLAVQAMASFAHAATDPEFTMAVNRMYANWLTQYSSTTDFRPNDRLTRQEAAKFFAAFQQLTKPDQPIPEIGCVFSDAYKFDPTLSEYIYLSCQMGLFKWTNGVFFGTEPLTKAQALTVLVRSVDGSKDETVSPWRKNYFTTARELWLTKERNVMAVDTPITRYEMALLLYRAVNGWFDPDQQEINELLDILLQLGIALE